MSASRAIWTKMKRKKTPERLTAEPERNGNSPEERAIDQALKNTFPASDPTSSSGSTASPAREHDSEEEPDS